MSSIKRIFIISLTGICLLSGIIFFFLHPTTNNHPYQVTITHLTYSPEVITIPFGAVVTFINKDTTTHWPASNNHPLHELYPEFDSNRALGKNESWSFTFKKSGKFIYHDHLNQSIRGIIIVEDPPAGVRQAGTEASTVREKIKDLVTKNGSLATWEYFQKNYTNTLYGAHDIAHYLGALLYKEYSLEKLTSCNPSYAFGCYHGFIEQFILQNGVDKLPRMITACKSIPNSDEENACYHGMGHGIVTHHKYQLLPSLLECDKLISDNNKVRNCYTGVFMENANVNVRSAKKEDPLFPCSAIESRYKTTCYQYQIIFLSYLYPNDVGTISKMCLKTDKQEYTEECIRGLGHTITQNNLTSPQNIIPECKKTETSLFATCIAAAAEEFVFQDQPFVTAQNSICAPLTGTTYDRCITAIETQRKNK